MFTKQSVVGVGVVIHRSSVIVYGHSGPHSQTQIKLLASCLILAELACVDLMLSGETVGDFPQHSGGFQTRIFTRWPWCRSGTLLTSFNLWLVCARQSLNREGGTPPPLRQSICKLLNYKMLACRIRQEGDQAVGEGESLLYKEVRARSCPFLPTSANTTTGHASFCQH